MTGRSNPSARVVIMDDISWSEPVSRRRSAASDLDPPSWVKGDSRPDERPAARRRNDHDRYVDEPDEPEVIEYAEALEDEEIWGPRPKLFSSEPGGRRTVVITGRGADRHVAPRTASRGNAPDRAQHGFGADRTAMWAVLLCVIVLLAAVAGH